MMDASQRWRKVGSQSISGIALLIMAVPIVIGLGSGLFWFQEEPRLFASGQTGVQLRVNLQQDESIYIPAVMVVNVAPTAIITPRAAPTSLATAFPTPVATATATPSPTPTVPAANILRFEGTSDQGQPVVVEIYEDLSRITRFEITAQIVCETNTGSVEISASDEVDYVIHGDRFQLRVPSQGGNEHLFLGSFSNDNSRMQGSWLIWLDGVDMLQPCNNKGEWSTVRQTF